MFEIPIPKDWADHSIGELDIRKKFNINIMGIKKSGKLELSISSDTVLKAGDTMLALGSNRNLQKCFHTWFQEKSKELGGGESMQDVILLVSTSAIFIFGYFLMNKLDVFLENNFEPITQNQITQIALWRDSQKSPVVDFFIGCLNKFAVDQSQM